MPVRVHRLLSAGAVGVLAVSFGAGAPAGAAEGPVPNAGSFYVSPWTTDPFVGVVNAVQAGPKSTVVYISVGAADPEVSSLNLTGFAASATGQADDLDPSMAMVRVVDTTHGKVYRSIQSSNHPECVCTSMKTDELPTMDPKKQMLTFATVLPPLPADVQSVDVDVTGRGAMVHGVKVSRGGALTPASGDGKAVVTGTGWPQLDVADAESVTDVKPFITDLITNVEDLDKTMRQQTTGSTKQVAISADVLFAVDKADLSSKADAQLRRVAGQLKNAQGTVKVTGHTDDTGSPEHNMDLSRRRAAAVVTALKKLSPGTSFTAEGKGETEPVADNTSAAGRQLNRRVTITLSTGGAR